MNNETSKLTPEEIAAAQAAEAARVQAIYDQMNILNNEKDKLEEEMSKYKNFIDNIVALKDNIDNTITKNENTYSFAMESIIEEKINSSFQKIIDYSIELKGHVSNLFNVYDTATSIYNSKKQRCNEIELEIANLKSQI